MIIVKSGGENGGESDEGYNISPWPFFQFL